MIHSLFGKEISEDAMKGFDYYVRDEMVCIDCKTVLSRHETFNARDEHRGHLILLTPTLTIK